MKTNNKQPTIIGGHSQETKNRMIAQRIRYGWRCEVNKYTNIRHIWIKPKAATQS